MILENTPTYEQIIKTNGDCINQKSYIQYTNSLSKGYIQDTNPLGSGYIHDKSIYKEFEQLLEKVFQGDLITSKKASPYLSNFC